MQFVHRIRTIWSWLPSFRAVGETEHLPSAATQLGIVPSSLSRTVKQLEDELGIPLFDRTTKTLILNESGKALLDAVREAMRIVDDAVAVALGDDVRVNVAAMASSDVIQALLIPASALLAATAPGLTLTIVSNVDDDGSEALLRGEVDAAIVSQPGPLPADLRSTELATWTRSVYGRIGRPAADIDRCVLVGTPTSHVDDGWPTERNRIVAVWAPDECAALELCARTDLVTVAFDAVARSCRQSERLAPQALPTIPSRAIHLIHRKAVGRHRRTEALVDAIQAALLEVVADRATSP